MTIVRQGLKRLLGKTDSPPMETHRQLKSSDLPAAPVCAFCGQPAAAVPCIPDGQGRLKPQGVCQSFAEPYLGHTMGLWSCPCTAIGSGAWGPDLDEAVALLQETLGIEPNDTQREQLRRFERDHADSFARLQEMFRLNHYELRLNTRCQEETSLEWLWVRETVS